eukprot:COSAG05_NODE_22700_length_263_cov_0.609756_1_plen_20_part_10
MPDRTLDMSMALHAEHVPLL